MSHETEQRRPVFRKSDLFWFLILPLLMAAAYFGYRHYQQTNADPNLRLVAKFSDDVSVEFKGLKYFASRNQQSKVWWKPNGLPLPDFTPDTSYLQPTPECIGMRMLYFDIEDRSGKDVKLRIRPCVPAGPTMLWGTFGDQDRFVLCCFVDDGFQATNNFTVECASQGVEHITVLTSDNPFADVLIAGMNAGFRAGLSDDETECEVAIFGPKEINKLVMNGQLQCNVEPGIDVFDISAEFSLRSDAENNINACWTFPKQKWSKITITYIDYDQVAEFQNVSVNHGSITTPRVVEPRSARQ